MTIDPGNVIIVLYNYFARKKQGKLDYNNYMNMYDLITEEEI